MLSYSHETKVKLYELFKGDEVKNWQLTFVGEEHTLDEIRHIIRSKLCDTDSRCLSLPIFLVQLAKLPLGHYSPFPAQRSTRRLD